MIAVSTPGLPWSVRKVDVEFGPAGPRFTYTLAARSDGRDVLTLRDERKRLALEAFSALDLARMVGDLERVVADVGQPEPALVQEVFADLVSFSKWFGPLGIGWGTTLPVTNPAAERAERSLEDAQRRLRGFSTSDEPWPKSRWVADFYGQGAGRWGTGTVRRIAEEVLRPHDSLQRIQSEQADLRMALDFVEAIARDEAGAIRSLIRDTPWAEGLPLQGSDPQGTDWRRVRRGGPPLGRRPWDPFAPGEDVDWRLFARLLLSNLIGRQLSYVLPYVDADRDGRLRLDLRPTSVLEVIYLQLLEQSRERPGFGVGSCGYCGGAILRTRLPSGATGNQWHDGRCGRAGRARRYRERHEQS